MHWALAVVALTLLAFAAISGRIAGTPITAAMVFTAVGLLVGSEALGLIEVPPAGETVKLLAEATLALVLFADASRIDVRALRGELSVPLRLLGIGLPADARGRIRRRARRVSRASLGRGAAPGGDSRADGCGARSSGRNADAAPEPSATGSERRERPERRDLRAAVLDRARDRAGGVRRDRRRSRGSAGARADRLRHPGRGGCAGIAAACVVVVAGKHRLVGGSWLQVVPAGRRRPRLRTLRIRSAAPASSPRSSEVSCSAPSGDGAAGRSAYLIEELGEIFNAVTFIVFGAVLLGPVLGDVTWSIALYAVLSLTVVRLIPVGISMIGTGARRPTLAFLGWFGPRGLASIVFAVLVLEEGGLPHDGLILTTTYVDDRTVGPRSRSHRGAPGQPLRHLVRVASPGRVTRLSRARTCGTFAGALASATPASRTSAAAAERQRPRRQPTSCVIWSMQTVTARISASSWSGAISMP